MQMSKRESPRGIREGQWSILSVQVFVNEEIGTTAQSITYDEFGNQLSNSNPDFQPFGYAGGLTDYHTDLIRFGARDYDPFVGRWISKEPLGFAGALNWYVYCDNDGVNYVDPSGLFTSWYGLVGGVLTAVGGATLLASGPLGAAMMIVGGALMVYDVYKSGEDAFDQGYKTRDKLQNIFDERYRKMEEEVFGIENQIDSSQCQ
jgi:RHS repeat-associated protein